ncbi:MAG: TonB-dependent receptor [Pseudomonadota bacterium]
MIKTRSLFATTTAAMALLAAPAFAQGVDDEIIVTATKRATTLQDTPVAVSVTTADVIEKAQILDIKDLQTVVPTFRVSQLQNSGNTTLTIRGFGNGGNNIGIEPSVGLFIDGVYRSRAAAQIVDLPNLQRVEVLSGPQSTLFGKNASAGVVSVVTAEPSFDSEGYIEGGIGNYNLGYVRGYITGAISDDLAVSLGGGLQSRDGYFDPAPGSTGGELNDLNRFNIRAQALWTPTDTFSARLIWDRNTIDENCCGVTTAIANPVTDTSPATAGNIFNLLGGFNADVTDPFNYQTTLNRSTDNDIDDQGISLTMDYDLDALGATLTSISAYRQNTRIYNSDSDFATIRLLDDVSDDIQIDTFTQELRLTSTNSGPFNWMIGGFYFNEDIDQKSNLEFGDQFRAYADTLGRGAAGLGPTDPSPFDVIELFSGIAPGSFFNGDIVVQEFVRQDNEAYSIFGTIDYDVTDRLTLTVGGNYTDDQKSVALSDANNDPFSSINLDTNPGVTALAAGAIQSAIGNPNDPIYQQFLAANGVPLIQPVFNALSPAQIAGFTQLVQLGISEALQPFQPFPQVLSFPNSVEDGKTSDDEFTYTLKAAYEVSDNLNVFVSTATGFKSSSWNLTRNSRPFFSDGPALAAAGLLPSNYVIGPTAATSRNFGTRFAGPEESTVYEIGLKARFPWGAFNITAFDQTIEGFQSTLFVGTGFVLANAGEQSTQGIEFDSTITPFEGLQLGVAGIIQDPVYDSYTGAPAPEGSGLAFVDLSGETPAGINEIALSFSAQYDFDLTDSLSAFVRADYQYEDEVQVVDNIPGLTRETNQLNAAAGLGFDNGLDLRFWVRNLNNDETFTSAFPGPLQPGTVYAYPNQPRTYGVSVRKNF